VGGKAPDVGRDVPPLKMPQYRRAEVDGRDHLLPGRRLYLRDIPRLRAAGWKGYWIDAASTLRMEKDCVIILDPVNLDVISRH